MATPSRNEVLEEIEKYKSLIKSAENKIKTLEEENNLLGSDAGDFIIEKVTDLSYTLAKQAGSLLDNILSMN